MLEIEKLSPTELSFLGGAASSFLAAVSYWAKTAHERRRATRAALYYLLELHHTVQRLRMAETYLPSQLVTGARKVLAERGGALSDSEASQVQAALGPMMKEFGRSQLQSLGNDLQEPFAKCLIELARENPVLAFQLRGRDRLTTIVQEVESLVANSTLTEAGSTPTVAAAEPIKYDTVLLDVAVAELEYFVKKTARGCGLLTYAKIWVLLRRAAAQEADEMRGLVEDLVRRLLHPPGPKQDSAEAR